jgi:hypothetical protein
VPRRNAVSQKIDHYPVRHFSESNCSNKQLSGLVIAVHGSGAHHRNRLAKKKFFAKNYRENEHFREKESLRTLVKNVHVKCVHPLTLHIIVQYVTVHNLWSSDTGIKINLQAAIFATKKQKTSSNPLFLWLKRG